MQKFTGTRHTLRFFQFDNLAQFTNIRHFVTKRYGGVSTGNYDSLNLSYSSGDAEVNVSENRLRLAKTLCIQPEQLVFPQQQHTDHVQVVDHDLANDLCGVDGLVTNQHSLCMIVQVADCVPVLLYDPAKKVVGAVHAGWRGTAGHIVQRAIQKMKLSCQSDPADLIAGIGPSIGPDSYEVGEDVAACFRQPTQSSGTCLRPLPEKGKYLLDLWKANTRQLMDAGVREENIEVAKIDTFRDDQFFSARRMGVQSGRFAAGVMIVA